MRLFGEPDHSGTHYTAHRRFYLLTADPARANYNGRRTEAPDSSALCRLWARMPGYWREFPLMRRR